jgi:hypothetical protein
MPMYVIAIKIVALKTKENIHFEISIDGRPRTYRDTKEMADQSAGVLKKQHPNSDVVVRVRRANDPIPFRPPGAPLGSRGSST